VAIFRRIGRTALVLAAALLLAGCGGGSVPARPAPSSPPAAWALAIHGGAGVTRASLAPEREAEYLAGLQAALRAGVAVLEQGGSSLDAVEQVVRLLEDDPLFNAGRGAVFNADGVNELDAAIMDGSTLACGSVAGVTTVKNPISLARLVMERTSHVLLVGDGAERFAAELGVERVAPEYFFTQQRWDGLQSTLAARKAGPGGETVGAVALDRRGNLAAATSTGGLTAKMAGRVGDSPIIGAGTYADDTTCAISASGKGEEFIRHGVARSIASWMELRGATLAEAVERVVGGVLAQDDGGVIAVDASGRIVMQFNTQGMFRGAADAHGRFEVLIWE